MDGLLVLRQVEATQPLEVLTAMSMSKKEEVNCSPILQGGVPGGLFVNKEVTQCTRCCDGLLAEPALRVSKLTEGLCGSNPGKEQRNRCPLQFRPINNFAVAILIKFCQISLLVGQLIFLSPILD